MNLYARLLLFQLLFQNVLASSRTLYLFKDVMVSNTTAIRTSGFNTLVVFGVGILDNGDIMYYSNTPGSVDTLVASNGSYVGSDALAAKMRSFKTGSDTQVTRLEICMNSVHVKELMASPGPGSSTRIYRNFAALKTAWNLDAVNNNDEAIYDLDSTVTFGKMVKSIGYKYTIVPYTRISHWQSVVSQLNSGLSAPNLVMDQAYLQCYDGGASNDPISWQSSLGIKVIPLVWVTNDAKPIYGTTPAQAKTKFTNWNAQGALTGGGYWNDFDIEKMNLSYTEYGNVLTSVFP